MNRDSYFPPYFSLEWRKKLPCQQSRFDLSTSKHSRLCSKQWKISQITITKTKIQISLHGKKIRVDVQALSVAALRSLCRRSTLAAPIEILGKWLFENFTPPDKRLKTVLELHVRHFHRANQLLWKGKLNSTAMKRDTHVDTSGSKKGMGKSWLHHGTS